MKLTDSAKQFLSKALGEEGFETLQKFELFKLHSNKVIDHEEIRTALMIVPRTVLSLLQKELRQMQPEQGKNITLPVEPEATLSVTKYENDVYSGRITRKNKILAQFKDRSIPGIGLVIMSTFELYDIEALASSNFPSFNDNSPKEDKAPEKVENEKPAADLEDKKSVELDSKKIKDLIDEKLELRDLVAKVVDQKLTEREAIDNFIRTKLTQILSDTIASKKQNG